MLKDYVNHFSWSMLCELPRKISPEKEILSHFEGTQKLKTFLL